MSETDPGYTGQQHAGDVGAHRATVGTSTERESVNVPPTRPGAAENARQAEAAREEHEVFIPEAPVADERSEAARNQRTEEESLRGEGGADDEEEDDVRKDIQQTRRDLGETVSALAGKADVKSRAGHAAQTARDKAGHVAETAKGRAGRVAETARGRAGHAAETVRGKASDVAGKARESTPEQARDVAAQARKRPVLLVAALGAVLGFMVRRMMMKRRARQQAARPRWLRRM
ncbi:DUF3618 domain-containing protein [Nonomuraea sp. KC401]|uniref:DUF3618 domain-containing protein n=1 Tax=unclassified Nonomuraea TaxID=2593643 RepID=UPI0010FD4A12|nr:MULTISPECIES: DUF3618 domain-containing protein [unclassified Nonomuraea]NBE98065.1 DUF3618 domain-containing protein [Nonomuraea sp. K271]TLF61749.1 DUF3618 domain-containing protein [Nonomuraea sp. KC401]